MNKYLIDFSYFLTHTIFVVNTTGHSSAELRNSNDDKKIPPEAVHADMDAICSLLHRINIGRGRALVQCQVTHS